MRFGIGGFLFQFEDFLGSLDPGWRRGTCCRSWSRRFQFLLLWLVSKEYKNTVGTHNSFVDFGAFTHGSIKTLEACVCCISNSPQAISWLALLGPGKISSTYLSTPLLWWSPQRIHWLGEYFRLFWMFYALECQVTSPFFSLRSLCDLRLYWSKPLLWNTWHCMAHHLDNGKTKSRRNATWRSPANISSFHPRQSVSIIQVPYHGLGAGCYSCPRVHMIMQYPLLKKLAVTRSVPYFYTCTHTSKTHHSPLSQVHLQWLMKGKRGSHQLSWPSLISLLNSLELMTCCNYN